MVLIFQTYAQMKRSEKTGRIYAGPEHVADTPPQGDPERKAIMDVLRRGWKGMDVVFVVSCLKVHKGWAWVHVLPQTRDGLSRYEDLSGLLRKLNGLWELVETAPGECADNPDCTDPRSYFRKLRIKYPDVPAEIFPY